MAVTTNRVFPGINSWEVISDTNTATLIFDREVQVLWAHIVWTSSAAVGNRRIRISMIETSSGIEWLDSHSGQQQAASLVRHYLFIQGVTRESNFVDIEIIGAMPVDFFITEGFAFRIEDAANISTADTFTALVQTRAI